MENLEEFVNDCLKEDLRHLEKCIQGYNNEIMEYLQLRNTVQIMQENLADGFKSQMNIGGNIFMEAKVSDLNKILVDVGKSCFIEFTLEEAKTFLDFKIAILTKESDLLREQSIKLRSQIKLALLCIGEQSFKGPVSCGY